MTAAPLAGAQSFDGSILKRVLGRFCTGIAVVTADTENGPVGFTCQSFSSLSLDPALVVLCVSVSSKTWPRIRVGGEFCVNVLASDQAAVSRRFAQAGTNRFAGMRWRPAPSGAPILDGMCAWIDCSLLAEHRAGDHNIVVGTISSLGDADEKWPLIYYRGTYGSLGSAGVVEP